MIIFIWNLKLGVVKSTQKLQTKRLKSELFKRKFFAFVVKFWMQFWNTFDTGTLFETKLSRPCCLLVFWQGTKWYRTTTGKGYGAWGFAGGASPINLYHVDVLNSDGDKRLSWHVNWNGNGGWRCGTTKSLNRSQNWERVFYQADWAMLANPRAVTERISILNFVMHLLLIFSWTWKYGNCIKSEK